MTRCVSDGASHDFPVEDSVQAYCPEHGVRLVWKCPAGLLPAKAQAADPSDEPTTT